MAEEIGVTKFLPSAWLDEAIPAPQRDVNDFIRADDGSWLMMPKDKDDQEEEFWRAPLQPGQVVAFMAYEYYGLFSITIGDDRSVDDDDGIPEKANCFCLYGEIDTLAHTLASLVENGDGSPLEPGIHYVIAYYWSDDETHFRFVVEDGNGRFEQCAGAN